MSKSHRFLLDIKDFEKQEPLGSGSYGHVYLARNKKTNDIFAGKIITKQGNKRSYKKLVKREIENMIRCQHPTIVKFFGYSLKDFYGENNVTIFMKREAMSLRNALDESKRSKKMKNSLDNTRKQKILIGIAKGMMILHQHNIIHRDLKPGNILLDENMNPVITDFGFSKFISAKELNKVSMSCGTPAYNSPEIISESQTYSEKTDVYSFAMIMYEIVTNERPFANMQPFRIMKQVSENEYRPSFKTPIKEGLKSLIEQCWDQDPKNRPSFEQIFNKLAYNIDETDEQFKDKIRVEEDSVTSVDDADDDDKEEYSDDDDDDGDFDFEKEDDYEKKENKYKYYLDCIDIGEVIEYANSIDGSNITMAGINEAIDEKIKNIKFEGHPSNPQPAKNPQQLNKIIDDFNKLKSDKVILEQKVTNLQKENEKLNTEKAALEQKVQRLSDEINPLKASNAELKNQVQNILSTIKTLQDKISAGPQIAKPPPIVTKTDTPPPQPKETKFSTTPPPKPKEVIYGGLPKEVKPKELPKEVKPKELPKDVKPKELPKDVKPKELPKETGVPKFPLRNPTPDVKQAAGQRSSSKIDKPVSEFQYHMVRSGSTNIPRPNIFLLANNFNGDDEEVFKPKSIPISQSKTITIEDFNNITLEDQIKFISEIQKTNKNPFFTKFNNLLNNIKSSIKTECKRYVNITSDNQKQCLNQIANEPPIDILCATIQSYEKNYDELCKLAANFSDVLIRLKFPSPKYQKAYDSISSKKKTCTNIKISVTITEMNRNDKNSFKQHSDSIDYADFSSSVKTIIGDASAGGFFAYSKSLTNLVIPLSVSSIGCQAFIGCKLLDTITFVSNDKGNNMKTIASQAFQNCENITEINIPDTVNKIGADSFKGCKKLNKLVIPNSVNTIEKGAFQDCPQLKEVDIPPSLASQTLSSVFGSNTKIKK